MKQLSLFIVPFSHMLLLLWRCYNDESYNRNITAFDGFDRASGGQEREEEITNRKKFNRHFKHIGQAVSTALNRCFPWHHPHDFSPQQKTSKQHPSPWTKTFSQSIFLILLQMSTTYRELHYSYFTWNRWHHSTSDRHTPSFIQNSPSLSYL